MTQALVNLLKTLELSQIDENHYTGSIPQVGWQRVYGGLVVAQALSAAMKTVNGLICHSLHGYFLRPGDPSAPIDYYVVRSKDGRSFVTRSVTAHQHGKQIFSMGSSFHQPEEGLDHQIEMPTVPRPEDLPSEAQLRDQFIDFVPENIKNYWQRERPIEQRPTDLTHYMSSKKLPPVQHTWIRANGELPQDDLQHQLVLAYATDMTLLDTALFAHGKSVFSKDLALASLDHAIWFHRPFKFDDWLLYVQDSPITSQARGFSRGSLYTREGVLIASTTQEGLIRLKRD